MAGFFDWIQANYIEFTASVLGLINIYFGIKEKSIFWIIATLVAGLYIYVYYESKVYAYMFLQFYYVGLGLYGFYYWLKGGKKNEKAVKVTHFPVNRLFLYVVLFIVVYFFITVILKKFTDSAIPYFDALLSTLSVFAAYMMMKKYIEHWFVWLVADIIAISIFINQKLFSTVILFVFYWIFAIVGYFQWRKQLV